MAVVDEEGRGWIRDPETGNVVEFGTPRSFVIRAREAERSAVKAARCTNEDGSTPIEVGRIIRAYREIVKMWREAIK